MARVSSTMVALGTIADDFILRDVTTNQDIQLNDQKTYNATVIMFICNHCPFVKHINAELTQLAKDYLPKNIRFLAINSNDINNYPDDSPENMKIAAEEHQYPFPYLFDETQTVARSYNAVCTPDFFIYDSKLTLVYRGQLDDSRPGNSIPVTGDSIRDVLECILNKKPITSDQKPSIGCNIKWKSA